MPDRSVDNLIQALFAGQATPEQMQALDAWLCKDRENARLLAEFVMLDGLLLVNQKVMSTSAILSALLEAEQNVPLNLVEFQSKKPDRRASRTTDDQSYTLPELLAVAGYAVSLSLRNRAVIKTAIAAALALCAALILALAWPSPPSYIADQPANTDSTLPAIHTVATLTAAKDAQWQGVSGDRLPVVGEGLRVGQRLNLVTGFAELTTNDGAVVILEAPATIELIDSPNALHLHTGKLVGLCHTDASKGFVVHTEHADITDLGTEVGVEANGQEITITVFTGEVQIDTPGGQPQSLVANQTARLNVSGNNRELVVEDKLAQGFDKLIRPAVVTDARINLEGFEVRVVPRGVREDAKLYTDRTYEINGIDADGIPAALLGGDLVMMPCDARPDLSPKTPGIGQMQVELELSRLSDIYILFPENKAGHLGHLGWLQQDYEKTGLTVGLDLDYIKDVPKSDPALKLGIGTGERIDSIMQVWQRKAPATGTFVAGEHIDTTMYSFVIVPRDKGGTDDLEQLNPLTP